MPTCIYCRVEDSEDAFDREHVLPEAFGKFKGALTLHRTVCKSCNGFFSGTLDLTLSRKAIEGLERYRWGIKKPSEITRFQFDHIQLRATNEGDFKDAPVELYHNSEVDKVLARPIPAVAIHNAEGAGFTYFSPQEIEAADWKNKPVDWKRGIKIFGPDETVARLLTVLDKQGVKPTKFRPLEPPGENVSVAQEFDITPMMRRAVAKIGFNYLAYRQGSEFALLTPFDPIRRFVRNGVEPALPPVHSTMDLPFRSAAPDDQRPVVHWVETTGHRSHPNLLATVMLFGYMNHVIMLAENFLGPWPELPVAHLYNPKTLTVKEMTPVTPRWRHEDRSAAP